MTRAPLLLLPLLLAACPDAKHNPAQVWIDLDGVETKLKLVDKEPPPF